MPRFGRAYPVPAIKQLQRGRVTFDAVGAGGTASAIVGATATASWSHTASGSGRVVVVAAALAITSGENFDVLTATYGGTGMTLLESEGFNDDPDTGVVVWGLLNPATGAQTVNVNVSSTGTGAASVAGSSVSYNGVGTFGPTDTEFGTDASSLSQTVASSVNEMIVQSFGQLASSVPSSYNQTQRDTAGIDATLDVGMVVGDAAGTGSDISFTTAGFATVDWAGVAVRLLPAAHWA